MNQRNLLLKVVLTPSLLIYYDQREDSNSWLILFLEYQCLPIPICGGRKIQNWHKVWIFDKKTHSRCFSIQLLLSRENCIWSTRLSWPKLTAGSLKIVLKTSTFYFHSSLLIISPPAFLQIISFQFLCRPSFCYKHFTFFFYWSPMKNKIIHTDHYILIRVILKHFILHLWKMFLGK